MKTIVYVSTNTKKDGAEKSLVSLQRYLRMKKGLNTLTIIPRHGPIEELLKESKIDYMIYRFEGNVNYNRGIKPLRGVAKCIINIFQAYRLSQILKGQNMEIIGVHSNTITSEFGCFLADDLHVPHIWHIREFGKLDFGFDFELGFKYIQKCAKRACKVVCNSRAVMQYYARYLDPKNLTYIYNGVNCSIKGENKWDSEKFRMILIGRLSDEKGQELALEACKILDGEGYKNFELDLYGDGINRDKYMQIILQYGLKKQVHLMGYSNNIPINQYQLGLMCSHHEAFGRVTVEYMVNGLPVIGVDSGGTSEIIEDGVTGYLINENDAKTLAARMKMLYSDRSLCAVMGCKGKKRAERMFTEQLYCENIYKLYEQCLDVGR